MHATGTQLGKGLNSRVQHTTAQHKEVQHITGEHGTDSKPNQEVHRVPACRLAGLGKKGSGVGRKKRSCKADRPFFTHFFSPLNWPSVQTPFRCTQTHTHTRTYRKRERKGATKGQRKREKERSFHRHIFFLQRVSRN